MEADFWHRRWRKNEIGFHLDSVNPVLLRFWPQLGLAPDARVLVPLCGKSKDLLWLAEHGHPVLGLELSEIAVRDLFREAGLTPVLRHDGPFERYAHGALQVLHGDFFALRESELAGVDVVYDRAALIALPPPMRMRYVEHLRTLLKPGTVLLLITLEYAQECMAGPPFSVAEAEVRALYQGAEVTLWSRTEVLSENPRFAAKGLDSLNESVYRIIL